MLSCLEASALLLAQDLNCHNLCRVSYVLAGPFNSNPSYLVQQGPGTGSISNSSTSTGRIAADVLSHPTTVSAESDFSLSEVFAGAVSPAGLAAAAAASSAADLFQSAPRTPAAASTTTGAGVTEGRGSEARTPRGRSALGGFGASAQSPKPMRTGSVIAAVAQAAVESAEEEAAAKRGASGGAAEKDDVEQFAGSARGFSSPPSVRTQDEEPLAMQGASSPARLEVPQALLSPTSPISGDITSYPPPSVTTPRSRVRDAAAGASGRLPRRGIDTAAARSDPATGDAEAALSPNPAVLSPGTDSDRGSTPSPRQYIRPELIGSDRGGSGGGSGRSGNEKDEERGGGVAVRTFRPAEEKRTMSPWITTRDGVRRVSGGPGGEGDDALSSLADARTVSISPQSATSSGGGSSSFWQSSGARGQFAFPAPGGGGAGADEAKGNLLAARAGKMRALGALDLSQVIVVLLVDVVVLVVPQERRGLYASGVRRNDAKCFA